MEFSLSHGIYFYKSAAYAGRKAAEVNLEELENAEKMEKEGKSFEEIFKRTGWFRGIDNRWRYEIDDSKMTFNR